MTSPSLNILLTGDEKVTADNDKFINLIQENLFKLQCIIKANGIRLSTIHEYQGKELLAFTIGTVDLCLYYLFDACQPPIIKNIPWFLSPSKTISALCFDPSGYWLLVASQDGSLHIVPAAGLVDAKRKTNQQKWKDADDIISLTSLNSQSYCSRPSSLIWWQCMSTSCQTGIIGTEQGEILFIDLDTGQQIGLTRIDGPISNFQICQDSELDTINLIITSQSKKQWFLVLEQPAKGYVYTFNNESSSASADHENTFTSIIKRWQGKSRLKGLKQLSFDNFSILKKKATKNKYDSSALASGTISSNDYTQCNGSDDLTIPSPVDSPALLTIHYGDHGQRLYSRYFSPTSLLTIHQNSSSLLPLSAYKLPDYCKDILLTQHLFYVIDRLSSRLSIISRILSQDKLKENSQFNRESVIAQFSFGKRNEVINGLFIANSNNENMKDNSFHNNDDIYTIPKIMKDLEIKIVPVNPCIIVTNCGIYRVSLRCNLLSTFMELIISREEVDKALRLAKIFGLHVRQLLEYTGDILLANDKFYQATTMFQKAKCRPSKIFAKLASVGCTSELLNCLVHFLEHPSPYRLSASERMSLSNLGIIAFTELSVRATTRKEQQIYKKFKEFLSTNLYYEELVTVSIVGQAHLWNILHHLVIKRGLFAQVLDILMKTLPLFFNFKNSYLSTNHDLLVTISEPFLIRGMIGNFSIAKSHMSFVLANLSSLQVFVLQRLILLYDPTNPVLRPLMAQCKTRKRCDSRSSLTNSLESIDVQEEMANLAEEVVEMFLMILLVLIQKTTSVLSHNPDLMKMISVSEMKKSYKDAAVNNQYKRRSISSGFSHVALLRNKVIYNWGHSITGCLGSGPVTGSVYETPQEINIFRRMRIEVISVSSGHCHTLALTNNGIYAWGKNQFGQIGLENLSKCPSPQLISSLSDETIIDAVAGQYHSTALTSDGRVFTWGWGIHGQLGHGSTENLYIPTMISSLLGICIKYICAGHAHTMILSSESIVYVFGVNNVGQLGTIDATKYLIPTIVDLLPEKISLIATQYFHNLALTSTNKLYIWGISPRELHLQNLKKPDLRSVDKGQNSVSAKSDSRSVDKKQNSVSSSSSSNKKRTKNIEKLVKNEQDTEIKSSKLSPSSCTPTLVDTSLVKGKIVQISAGWNHSALITKDGTVYIWGKNTCGQLGNNNKREIVRPTPLIYNPVLSFSQDTSKSVGNKSIKDRNGLIKNGTASNYRMNVEKENCDKDESAIDNKGDEKDEMNDDNHDESVDNVKNNDDEDDSVSNADDGEIKDSFNCHNDLNEKDIDDFENCMNSNNSELKAVEISCGSYYTVAVQQGGGMLAWGRMCISFSKPQTLVEVKKRSDKKICDNVEESLVTPKYPFHTLGLQRNESVVCTSNPSQIPNIPAPVISYQSYDIIPLAGIMPTLRLVDEIPGERILHFTLEQFYRFYDVHKIMKKCIALGNHQACAKLALLEHNFSESIMYQLKSLMDIEFEKETNNITELPRDEKRMNCTDFKEQKIENLKEPKNVKKEEIRQVNGDERPKFVNSECNDQNEGYQSMDKYSTHDNLNYNSLLIFDEQVQEDLVNSFEESINRSKLKMSTSKSMDTLSSTENELHIFNCQGGSEEMYGQVVDDDNNIPDHLTMTNNVTFDDELASDNSFKIKNEDDFISVDKKNYHNSQDDMNNEVSSIKKAMSIVEFYINETENVNHVIVRDVLLKAINTWLDLCLPLQYLEKVFLKNLDKIFYPLGLLLFCQSNVSEDVNNDGRDDARNVTKAFNSLSTKLALNVCSVLLQHINQGKSTPEYVELLSQLIAKSFGPPLTGYPGSSGNHTMDQMLEGMRYTLSSKQSDPRPFIHIKDPDKVSRFLEMENDTIVFTCGHYLPISSSEFVPRLETELLVSHLPCTAEVLGRVFQQNGQLETLCPQCIPRALQTVVNNSTNR